MPERRSRSKSPARRTRAAAAAVSPEAASPAPAAAASPPKAAAAAAPPAASGGLEDAQIQLGIAVVVLTAIWYQCEGEDFSLAGFATRCGEGFTFNVPQVPKSVPILDDVVSHVFGTTMNFVAQFHILNTIVTNRNTHGGFWLQNFANTLLAGFAVNIVPKILTGTSPVEAIFANPAPDTSIFTFFVLWYVLNYGVGPLHFGRWTQFAAIGGDALKKLLAFATLMYVSKAVGGAVGVPQAMFTKEWFAAVAGGLIAANANGYFPYNKGFSFEKSAAFAPVFFLASDGFAAFDTVAMYLCKNIDKVVTDLYGAGNEDVLQGYYKGVAPGAQVNGLVASAFGDHLGNFVIAMIAINFLFGEFIRPHIPLDTRDGFDVFDLVGKFTNLIQLN